MYQTIVRYPRLLTSKNRLWIHFVSQKVGRLLLPWLLLLVGASSFGLPPVWRVVALAAQSAFFALVLADLIVGNGSPLKRVTSAARALFVLVAAAFCALFYWLLPRRIGWEPTGSSASSAR
jgi:hypothetical protein